MKLTDKQWQVVSEFIPKEELTRGSSGRPWHDARDVLNGIFWVVKTGARWCDLPEQYPPYQTCHRRFQRWAQSGVFQAILASLVQDLEKRGKINLTETFIDATYVDAQKGGLKSVKPSVETGPRSWQSQTANLFLCPFLYRQLHDMRVSLLIKRFGPFIQSTYLRELWVTKLTILILSTGRFKSDLESQSLLPISAIESQNQLKMDVLLDVTDEDGLLNDFSHGYSHSVESKFGMNEVMLTS